MLLIIIKKHVDVNKGETRCSVQRALEYVQMSLQREQECNVRSVTNMEGPGSASEPLNFLSHLLLFITHVNVNVASLLNVLVMLVFSFRLLSNSLSS